MFCSHCQSPVVSGHHRSPLVPIVSNGPCQSPAVSVTCYLCWSPMVPVSHKWSPLVTTVSNCLTSGLPWSQWSLPVSSGLHRSLQSPTVPVGYRRPPLVPNGPCRSPAVSTGPQWSLSITSCLYWFRSVTTGLYWSLQSATVPVCHGLHRSPQSPTVPVSHQRSLLVPNNPCRSPAVTTGPQQSPTVPVGY